MKFSEYEMVEAIDLNKAAPIKWTTDTANRAVGKFRVGSTNYRIEFGRAGNQIEVVYGIDTGGGWLKYSTDNVNAPMNESLKVIATVLSGMREYIEKYEPNQIFFTAYDSDEAAKSRNKLYARLVKRFAKTVGYDCRITDNEYLLTRKRKKDIVWTEQEVQNAIARSGDDQPFVFSVEEFKWLKPKKEILVLGKSEDGYDFVVIPGEVKGDKIHMDYDDNFVSDDPSEAQLVFEEW